MGIAGLVTAADGSAHRPARPTASSSMQAGAAAAAGAAGAAAAAGAAGDGGGLRPRRLGCGRYLRLVQQNCNFLKSYLKV